MPIIKLNATDSTNLYLKRLALSNELEDFTVIVAKLQQKGRGQMGSVWCSDDGKNLTFSVLRIFTNFPVHDQFNLNCIVSIAIYDVLNEMAVPNLSVKWPNDILSGNQKICGILIENILKGRFISKSIIGIGLNVNQTNFNSIKQASSLKQILNTSIDYDLNKLLNQILDKLKFYFGLSPKEVRDIYTKLLFRKDKPSTFSNNKEENFVGFIRGVNASGKLMVQLEDQIVMEYGLKEVKLLY